MSFSKTLSPKTMNRIMTGLIILSVVVFIIIIVLAVLAGMGILPDPRKPTGPPLIDVAVGEVASFSPTAQNKVWTKVFDSNNKCFVDMNQTSESISTSTYKKLYSHIINKGLKLLDNPFKGCIDVPIIHCSDNGEPTVLTLNLSEYGGKNPFKKDDVIYIYGVQGVTNINGNIEGKEEGENFQKVARSVYQVPSGDPNDPLGYNQIMIGVYENSVALSITEGTYSGGGTVRLVSRSNIGFVNFPEDMFYVYMSYKNTPFYWPFSPVSPSTAYNTYSRNFKDYITWVAGLSPVCSFIFTEPRVEGPPFTNGKLEVIDGGGIEIYYINCKFYAGDYSFYLVTAEGNGGGDASDITVTVKQGELTKVLTVRTKCYDSYSAYYGPLAIPPTTSPEQLKAIIDLALELEPNINTISTETANPPTKPSVNRYPNFIIKFNITKPTSLLSRSRYIETSQDSIICSKIGGECSIQTIYTTGDNVFDFINNSGLIEFTEYNEFGELIKKECEPTYRDSLIR